MSHTKRIYNLEHFPTPRTPEALKVLREMADRRLDAVLRRYEKMTEDERKAYDQDREDLYLYRKDQRW